VLGRGETSQVAKHQKAISLRPSAISSLHVGCRP
jgi:hypothetical protein